MAARTEKISCHLLFSSVQMRKSLEVVVGGSRWRKSLEKAVGGVVGGSRWRKSLEEVVGSVQ